MRVSLQKSLSKYTYFINPSYDQKYVPKCQIFKVHSDDPDSTLYELVVKPSAEEIIRWFKRCILRNIKRLLKKEVDAPLSYDDDFSYYFNASSDYIRDYREQATLNVKGKYPHLQDYYGYISRKDGQLFIKRLRKLYLNLLENMKKYISTLYQNMDLYTSVRISISYYSRTRMKSPRILAELLIRAGNLVVVIGLPRAETLSRTLRAMLTHLVAFPITLNRMIELNHILVSRTDLQHHAFLTPRKPLEIVFPDPSKRPRSLHSLMESLALLMENFSQSALPGRLSIPAFSDMRAMVDCLAMNYIGLYEAYLRRYPQLFTSSEETIQKQR
jgi:hypothetical protein